MKNEYNAWMDVMKAVRRYGAYREKEALESMDELTRECVKTIGFFDICTMEKQIAFDKFTEVYRALAKREIRIEFDKETAKWFRKHIGCQTTVCQCEKCKLVYKPSLGHKCKESAE